MNQDKIWEYFQVNAIENFDDAVPRLDFLVRQMVKLSQERQPRVLNIGSGNGWLERRCLELGFETHAVDPIDATIDSLRTQGIDGQVGSIDDLPYPDNHFGAVFCSEVLEHLDDATLRRGLEEIARVLRRGGHLFGTVPFKENLQASVVVCPDCGNIFHRWGHQRNFDKQSLELELDRAGLKTAVIRTYAFPDYSKDFSLNRLRQWLRWILGRFGSGHVYTNLYFQAVK